MILEERALEAERGLEECAGRAVVAGGLNVDGLLAREQALFPALGRGRLEEADGVVLLVDLVEPLDHAGLLLGGVAHTAQEHVGAQVVGHVQHAVHDGLAREFTQADVDVADGREHVLLVAREDLDGRQALGGIDDFLAVEGDQVVALGFVFQALLDVAGSEFELAIDTLTEDRPAVLVIAFEDLALFRAHHTGHDLLDRGHVGRAGAEDDVDPDIVLAQFALLGAPEDVLVVLDRGVDGLHAHAAVGTANGDLDYRYLVPNVHYASLRAGLLVLRARPGVLQKCPHEQNNAGCITGAKFQGKSR
ncbi:MAG: hypothetical protein BWY87_01594 [Deltaproteobacteria bacterium ADurb.Bin510]|nr:MAG: hypothetical protein BWY87_01594 [Deltaproteobacteria bacterium ADurb.Bin510]